MLRHLLYAYFMPNMTITRWLVVWYTIMILYRLLIYTSMKHSLLQTFEKALALQSLDTLSDVRMLLF
jgi:hypothetical protein